MPQLPELEGVLQRVAPGLHCPMGSVWAHAAPLEGNMEQSEVYWLKENTVYLCVWSFQPPWFKHSYSAHVLQRKQFPQGGKEFTETSTLQHTLKHAWKTINATWLITFYCVVLLLFSSTRIIISCISWHRDTFLEICSEVEMNFPHLDQARVHDMYIYWLAFV